MITNKLDVRSALVALALGLFGALGIAACAAPVDSGEEAVTAGEEPIDEVQDALGPYQCCFGYYTCSTTHHQFSYSKGVDCGGVSSNQAIAACIASCSGGSCSRTVGACVPH